MLKDFDSSELCDISMEISKKATLDKIVSLISQQFVDQWLVDVKEARSANLTPFNPLK